LLLDVLGHASSKDIHHVVLDRHLLLLLLLHGCWVSRPKNVEQVQNSTLCLLLRVLLDWWCLYGRSTHQHSIEVEKV